jgi:hypothetical protein
MARLEVQSVNISLSAVRRGMTKQCKYVVVVLSCAKKAQSCVVLSWWMLLWREEVEVEVG